MPAGPTTTIRIDGKIKRIRGKIILTGVFIATCSAFCRRRIRISLLCVRIVWPMLMPNKSASIIARTNEFNSGTLVLAVKAFRASVRDRPSCISLNSRENSSLRGPGILSIKRPMAASKLNPALYSRVTTGSSFWRVAPET